VLALIASEPREFSGLLRHVEGITNLDWELDFAQDGLLNGRAIVMAANGPGPELAALAAQAIKEHYELEGLASIGFCGALSPDLRAFDIVIATSLVGKDQVGKEVVAHALCVPRSHSCERSPSKLLSLDHVATTPQEKSTLRARTQADAIEMESAGLAKLAVLWQIPLYAIKVVTDTAGESFPLDFNLLRDRNGRFSRPKIIAATLRHPSAIPALINLNRRCTQAAQTLGDFLARTSF
jgi:adenosylhomocysteine nucleosidase